MKEVVKQTGLPFAYAQQAVKEAVEAYNSWAEAGGRPPEVRRVAPYVDERTWRFDSATALSIRLMSGRHAAELWPHKRFWLFEWLVRGGRAKRASTIRLRRVKNRVYAMFTYEVEPEAEKEPAAVAAFDVNDNTVVVARVDLKASADRVAQWNRKWVQPSTSIKVFKTDFGRLAKRYAAIRRKWAEGLSVEVSGRKLSGVHTREFRKRVKRLREGKRKRDRVNKIAHELTREPVILVAEDLGRRPQEEMVERAKSAGLRHRIKQMPIKAVVGKVRDRAAERGLRFVFVSASRYSKTCPVHREPLSFPLGPKMGLCPHGHWVHRDVAAVLNILKKAAEELEPKYAEVVRHALSTVDKRQLEEWSAIVLRAERTVKARWPAVLARAGPMTPPGAIIPAGDEGAYDPP
ncbi:zinc ribbon domain-containing protein [Pyrobaculum ferrireducens]|uniref:Transposase n=1 Tax=Pyrobaculum ferrireducens TaxID=1104324 RepID=G7VDT4_9CREN|nr:zinc ribbon domain-containing protein [Pyrobaculum ferrireducens]AET31516.1 transposase [Pyrobaculum ferrireducens]